LTLIDGDKNGTQHNTALGEMCGNGEFQNTALRGVSVAPAMLVHIVDDNGLKKYSITT
jgi:hypothetical protein